MYHILIAEDDKVLRYGLQKCLEEEGYAVMPAENYIEISDIIKSHPVDLAILDVNLPEKDGFDIYKRLLSVRGIPAVFLTARDEEDDVMRGFDLGAEDYITKPFSVNIFLKKIAAVMRRCHGKESSVFTQGDLTVCLQERKVFLKDEQLNLSPTEYRLLEIFIKNANRVLTKETLMDGIWDKSVNWADDHSLTVNISRLRGKLGHAYIKTVFGVGYMWDGTGATDGTDGKPCSGIG